MVSLRKRQSSIISPHFAYATQGEKRQRKPEGKPRMENPQTLATLDTQNKRRRQRKHKNTTKHRKLKRCASNFKVVGIQT